MAKFTEVTAQQLKKTLVRSFIPLADSLRDLLTKFGLRIYKVTIIRVQWSGGKRGIGAASVITSTPILPTPLIGDLNSLTAFIQSVGTDELGSLSISKISGRFTEEELRGLSKQGEEIPDDEEVYWEVEFPNQTGDALKRRFLMRAAPVYSPGSFQWTVRLERSHEDRARNGDVE